jgi:hypothetical protein
MTNWRGPAMLEAPEHAWQSAQALAAQGQFAAAIERLTLSNRQQRCTAWESALAQWRYQAFAQTSPRSVGASTGAEVASLPLTEPGRLPQIDAAQLNASVLRRGIQQHGALLVRGLLDEPRALDLAAGISHAIAACRAAQLSADTGAEADGWYRRLALDDSCEIAQARPWVESAGGVWLADSPRLLAQYLDLLEQRGVVQAIAGYFGERPMLSVGKSTLRCVPHDIRLSDWHQDGAFLGTEIRSVNLWLSLSHCGVEASGLDLLPRRLDRIVQTGTPGANFEWSVSPALVDQLAGEHAIESPVFAPGDALLFDHYLLHRTGIPAGIARDRYAIEAWFFAPAAYPAQQAPLYI